MAIQDDSSASAIQQENNFHSIGAEWCGNDNFAVSKKVSLGRFAPVEGFIVDLSAYASRWQYRGEYYYRYFGNYQVLRDGKTVSDQRGIDIDSAQHLALIACRATLRLATEVDR